MTASLGEQSCRTCGILKPFSEFYKHRYYSNGVRSQCKVCCKKYERENAERTAERRSAEYRKNKAEKQIYHRKYAVTLRGRANRIFHGARRRAKVNGLEIDITTDDILAKLRLGRCEQTGIKFFIGVSNSLFAPSLDRKDSAAGYTLDNVQLVCAAYNFGKNEMSDDEYETFILSAADNIKSGKI